MAPSKTTLSFKRGDTFKRDFQIVDPKNDFAPIPIVGWTILCQIRYSDTFIAQVDVTVTDDALGEFTLSMDPVVTETISPRTYQCDVEFQMPNGEKSSSETFYVSVKRDVTSNV
jgi:hypothetical protein